jgi:hypothetical protein
MPVIATAELTIDVPVPVAFQRFTDYSSWDLWMPPTFRPITGPARQLRAGDVLTVDLGETGRRVRTDLNVIRVRPNREVCWRAGLPGVLIGEHSFFFSDASGRTALRSEEPFSGVLAHRPLANVIERSACRLHNQMLTGFATHVRASSR